MWPGTGHLSLPPCQARLAADGGFGAGRAGGVLGTINSWPIATVVPDRSLAAMIFWTVEWYLAASPLSVSLALTVTRTPSTGGISSLRPTRIDVGLGSRLVLAQ